MRPMHPTSRIARAWMREPALLVPGQKPLGPVQYSGKHSAVWAPLLPLNEMCGTHQGRVLHSLGSSNWNGEINGYDGSGYADESVWLNGGLQIPHVDDKNHGSRIYSPKHSYETEFLGTWVISWYHNGPSDYGEELILFTAHGKNNFKISNCESSPQLATLFNNKIVNISLGISSCSSSLVVDKVYNLVLRVYKPTSANHRRDLWINGTYIGGGNQIDTNINKSQNAQWAWGGTGNYNRNSDNIYRLIGYTKDVLGNGACQAISENPFGELLRPANDAPLTSPTGAQYPALLMGTDGLIHRYNSESPNPPDRPLCIEPDGTLQAYSDLTGRTPAVLDAGQIRALQAGEGLLR